MPWTTCLKTLTVTRILGSQRREDSGIVYRSRQSLCPVPKVYLLYPTSLFAWPHITKTGKKKSQVRIVKGSEQETLPREREQFQTFSKSLKNLNRKKWPCSSLVETQGPVARWLTTSCSTQQQCRPSLKETPFPCTPKSSPYFQKWAQVKL